MILFLEAELTIAGPIAFCRDDRLLVIASGALGFEIVIETAHKCEPPRAATTTPQLARPRLNSRRPVYTAGSASPPRVAPSYYLLARPLARLSALASALYRIRPQQYCAKRKHRAY